jgi:hypothetical protein
MTELQRIGLTKSDLDRIPSDERFFFLIAGHLANDINILATLLIVAFQTGRQEGHFQDGPRAEAAITQQLLLIRVLAGRLHEANRLIGTEYFGKGFHSKYESDLSDTAKDALRRFGAYFGGKNNIISRLRNRFAFHLNREEIEEVYNDIDTDFPFVTYGSDAYRSHCLFYGSEILYLNAMATITNSPTALEGLDRIYGDTTEVCVWLGLFLTGFMQVMITRYIGVIKRNQLENLDIGDDPSISRYTLPFFAGPPDKQP